jgi:hypothetical protein
VLRMFLTACPDGAAHLFNVHLVTFTVHVTCIYYHHTEFMNIFYFLSLLITHTLYLLDGLNTSLFFEISNLQIFVCGTDLTVM